MDKPLWQQRIDNGAQFLDTQLGFEWAMKINTMVFDINSHCKCVLGQIFGYYGDGMIRFALTKESAIEYGFWPHSSDLSPATDFYSRNDERNAYWRKVIQQRQGTFKGAI